MPKAKKVVAVSGLYRVDISLLGKPPTAETEVLKQGVYFLEGEEADAKEEAVQRFLEKEVRPLLAVKWQGPLTIEKATSRKKGPVGNLGSA